jgi:hypothetical protein
MITDDEWDEFLDNLENNSEPETTEYPVTIQGLRKIVYDLDICVNIPNCDDEGNIVVDDEIIGDLRKFSRILNYAADVLETNNADIVNIQVNEENGVVDFSPKV